MGLTRMPGTWLQTTTRPDSSAEWWVSSTKSTIRTENICVAVRAARVETRSWVKPLTLNKAR